MSILGLFGIGTSGIFANQLALRVASNNIANVNTPGYSRQDVIMKIANPVQLQGEYLGRGVGDADTRRFFDNFIYHQIIGQSYNYGRNYSLDRGFSQVEQIFNETQGYGLLHSMEDYFNMWQEVATNPDGNAQRSTLLIKARAFVNVARQMESDIKNTVKFLNDEIGDVVKHINVLTKNIAEVNGKIMEVEAGGVAVANVFRDQREQMMKELAELIDYDWHEDKDGTVTIVAGRRSIVAGVYSYDMTTAINLDRDRDIYGSGTNMTSYIKGGKLGGFIAVREDIKNNSLLSLRRMVASITQETNHLHEYSAASPTYDLDGNQGTNFFNAMPLFTRDETTGGSAASITASSYYDTDPSVLALNEYDIVFLDAANFQVRDHATGAVVGPASRAYTSGANIDFNGIRIAITDGTGTPAAYDTFFVSPLETAIENFDVTLTDGRQVAAAKALTTLPGDNTNALDIISLNDSNIANLNNISFEDYYAEIVSTVGSMSQAASDSLEYDHNLLFELQNRRESASGVSLDEEAANIIRYQRAFEASARIIKLTDELMELVVNL
jgi:flagellar hook-associated protein 1 FlgK